MPRPRNPSIVAIAAQHSITYKHAFKVYKGLHDATRSPGRPRRTTPPDLRLALEPFIVGGFSPLFRQEIALKFSLHEKTVDRHLGDMRRHYANTAEESVVDPIITDEERQ